jgi:hypothetical protein
MHEMLKADGVLPKDHSYRLFVERMGVDGYVRHLLTGEGSGVIRRRFGALSTKLDQALRRKWTGSVEQINEEQRRRIARVILDLPADAVGPEVDDAVKRLGLSKLRYFEEDLSRVLDNYSRTTSKALANRRMLKLLREQFPEGDRFAAISGSSLAASKTKAAVEVARAAGYRRLRGAALAQLVPGVDAWAGWKKHRGAIDALVQQFPPGHDRTEALLKYLDDNGLPVTREMTDAAHLALAKDIYLPMQAADMVEDAFDPAVLDAVKHPFGAGVLDIYDALTNWFKSSVTVNALAFHGRNAISNTVQNLLVHGPDTLRPSIVATGIAIRTARDNKEITFGGITRTAREWRDAAARHGVLSELAQITESGRSIRDTMVDVPAALKVGAAGAAVGVVGYTAEAEDPESRYAIGAGLLGGFFGLGTKANYDIMLDRAVRTGLAERSWSAAYDQFIHDTADLWKDAGKVAAGTGALGALAGPGGAVAGAALGGGSRFLLEGSTIVGGALGREIESQARLAGWLAGIRKGMSEAASADLVNRSLFDYGDLTSFEKSVLRRAFPFYTWTSKNIAAQAWMAANQPAQYAAMTRFMDATTKGTLSSDDMAVMDSHLRYRWAIGTGLGRLVAAGVFPIEAFAELTKLTRLGNIDRIPAGLLQMVNPSVRVPVEWAADLSLYYNRPISTMSSGRDFQEAPKAIQDFLGFEEYTDQNGKQRMEIGRYRDENGDLRPNTYTAARRLYLLRSFPPYRLVTELMKAVNKTYMSGTQDAPGAPATLAERALNIGIGLKSYQFDPDAQRDLALDRWEALLSDEARRLGLAKQVSTLTTDPLRLE